MGILSGLFLQSKGQGDCHAAIVMTAINMFCTDFHTYLFFIGSPIIPFSIDY